MNSHYIIPSLIANLIYSKLFTYCALFIRTVLKLIMSKSLNFKLILSRFCPGFNSNSGIRNGSICIKFKLGTPENYYKLRVIIT